MPWLIRDSKQYVERASPATMKQRFPAETFVDGSGNPVSGTFAIWNPDLTAVAGFDSKYWIIAASPSDAVTLMSPAERAAVDAQEQSDQYDALSAQLDQTEDILRAFALAVLDEINLLRAQHSLSSRTITQLKNAVRNKLGS